MFYKLIRGKYMKLELLSFIQKCAVFLSLHRVIKVPYDIPTHMGVYIDYYGNINSLKSLTI